MCYIWLGSSRAGWILTPKEEHLLWDATTAARRQAAATMPSAGATASPGGGLTGNRVPLRADVKAPCASLTSKKGGQVSMSYWFLRSWIAFCTCTCLVIDVGDVRCSVGGVTSEYRHNLLSGQKTKPWNPLICGWKTNRKCNMIQFWIRNENLFVATCKILKP